MLVNLTGFGQDGIIWTLFAAMGGNTNAILLNEGILYT